MPSRSEFLSYLAQHIRSRLTGGVLRVAITGPDGAGKTTLADELETTITSENVPVIRIGIDGFHNPMAVRYARGRHSPEGYFLDSFNLTEFKRSVLDPLSPGGSGNYRVSVFDHRTDKVVDSPWRQAPAPSVLIVDGIFLQKPELAHYWDLVIFLDTPFAQTFQRMARRDGSPADEFAMENRRYRDGQLLYFEQCRPQDHADVVVDYSDVSNP